MAEDPYYLTLAASLATHLATNLLDASARRVREKFTGNAQGKALRSALQASLQSALQKFAIDNISHHHLQSLFEQFFERPDVIDEFTVFIDPRPDHEINITLLRSEFQAAGFDPDSMYFTRFEIFITCLFEEFYVAASMQSELQGAIQIGLLRSAVEDLKSISAASEKIVSHTRTTAEATSQLANDVPQLMENLLRGQAETNQISKAIEEVAKQGFAQNYALLEQFISSIHKTGYDIDVSDDRYVIGDKVGIESGLSSSVLKDLQIELSRLRQVIAIDNISSAGSKS
jgi:hypothetical protein